MRACGSNIVWRIEDLSPYPPVHLPVGSLPRAINFYALVLGFEVTSHERTGESRRVQMSARGCSDVVLHAADGVPPTDGRRRAVLMVPDVERARADAWNAGATVPRRGPAPIDGPSAESSRSIFIRDPEGNELELAETR